MQVPLDANRLQEVQRAELVREVPDAVVEEEEGPQIGAHAQLGGQLRDLVVRGVEVGEVA